MKGVVVSDVNILALLNLLLISIRFCSFSCKILQNNGLGYWLKLSCFFISNLNMKPKCAFIKENIFISLSIKKDP